MKIILNSLITPFALLLLLPIIIVLLPFAFIEHIMDRPAKRKRHELLLKTIATKWKRDKKYIYLCYSEDWNLASQLEQVVIPKYKDYMIVDSWSDTRSEWIHHYDDKENRVSSIVQDIFRDYDGNFDTYVGFLDADRREIETEKTLSYMQATEGYVFANGQDKKVTETITEIDDTIQSYLKSAGIIY